MEEKFQFLQNQIDSLQTLVVIQGELIESYIDFSENGRSQPSVMYADSKYKKLLKQSKQLRKELGL